MTKVISRLLLCNGLTNKGMRLICRLRAFLPMVSKIVIELKEERRYPVITLGAVAKRIARAVPVSGVMLTMLYTTNRSMIPTDVRCMAINA